MKHPGKISARAKKFAEYEAKRKLCYAERRHQQFKRKLLETIKSIPWWLISSVFHLLLLILSTHIIIQYIEIKPIHVFHTSWLDETPLAVESQIKAEVQKEEKDLAPQEEKKAEIPVITEIPPVPVEKEIQTILGVEATTPNPQQATPASPFSGRSAEGKGDALKKYGGSAGTEAAVKNGLDWLVRHQISNGSWSGTQYIRCCRGEPCDQETIYYDYISGFTGLALLCFLGAGETHLDGEHSKTVSKGLQFLLKNQRNDGYFGPDAPFLYNHAIATLALIEAYGITKDPKLKDPGQRGIDFLCQSQQPGGGWDYYYVITGRNDTSITGWVVMALKSARSSGFMVPPSVWKKAQKCIDKMYDSAGSYAYADKGPPSNFKGRKGAGMAAVGALCTLYFGEPLTSPRIQETVHLLKKYRPLWQRLVETNPNPVQQPGSTVIFFNKDVYNYSVYAWYYGTLVLFQVGGEEWDAWNNALKEALLSTQNRKGCDAGSWDPVEKWIGPYGGRLYSTTLNILNLEVYYRYLPLYQTIEVPPELTDKDIVAQAQKVLEEGSQRNKAKALDQLSEILDEEARKTALKQTCEMLKDESLTIRWKAIKTLRQMKSEDSLPAIFDAYRSKKNKMLRRFIIETVAEFPHPSVFPFLIQVLEGKEDTLRTKALDALKFWSGENLGSSPEAWKKWWDARQKNIPNPH